MTRLNQFLDVDDAARDRAALLSSVAGIVAFVLGKVLLDMNGKSLGWLTFGAVGSAYLTRLWWYCSTSQRQPVRTDRFLVPRRFAMGAASIAILILFSIAPPDVVEAAMLDRKLRALTQDQKLSPEQAEEVGSLLDAAAKGPIKLPEGTRVQVYRAIKNSWLEYPTSRPFVDAAEGIVRYTRTVEPPPLDPQVSNSAGSSEAWAVYRRGVAYALAVHSGGMHLPTPKAEDALRAIAEFTRTIELATGPENRKLLSEALLMRATMHLYLVQPEDVLRDAEAAESKGNTDLSTILELEGIALLHRGHHQDLERAICIFTLLLNLPPPTWVKLSDVRATALFQIDALGNLGKVYFTLGKFEDAIRETESLIDRIDRDQGVLQLDPQTRLYTLNLAYLQLIASYLQLGNLNQAVTAAHTWADKTGDPDASSFISYAESGHFDKQLWLQQYMIPIARPPAVP
jgi:hypothetical protein